MIDWTNIHMIFCCCKNKHKEHRLYSLKNIVKNESLHFTVTDWNFNRISFRIKNEIRAKNLEEMNYCREIQQFNKKNWTWYHLFLKQPIRNSTYNSIVYYNVFDTMYILSFFTTLRLHLIKTSS